LKNPDDNGGLDRLTGAGRPGGNRRMRAILVLAGTVLFMLSPLASGGFGGFDPTQFPVPQDRPPVQPAGYAFSIWGLIYLWLLLHAGYGLFLRAEDRGWDAPRWPLAASLGVGAAWISVAQISAIWATVLIWLMLAGALAAAIRAPRGGGADRWVGAAPIGVYAGWLTAASWVSVGLLLAGYGLLGAQAAALVALAGALVFAVLAQGRLPGRPEYGLTVTWALVAVSVANSFGDRPDAATGVALLAGIGALAMAGLALRTARQP